MGERGWEILVRDACLRRVHLHLSILHGVLTLTGSVAAMPFTLKIKL